MTADDGAIQKYRRDVTPVEAWQVLTDDRKAVLVDVRTEAEWNFVGVTDLSAIGKEAVLMSWKFFPGNQDNPKFVDDLSGQVSERDVTLLFLCRSGVRSKAAAVAMTRAGYTECFNISEGFEGDLDASKHRGVSSGWKTAALPWVQG